MESDSRGKGKDDRFGRDSYKNPSANGALYSTVHLFLVLTLNKCTMAWSSRVCNFSPMNVIYVSVTYGPSLWPHIY